MAQAVGLNAKQLAQYVIRPTINYLGWGGSAAERLVLGTAITESGLRYIKQMGNGPAMGIYQMEPATHDDIWENFLQYKEEAHLIETYAFSAQSKKENLYSNLAYATAMCRAHYRRFPGSLPSPNDGTALAYYWKEYYNTHLGAGDPEEATQHFNRAITVFEDLS